MNRTILINPFEKFDTAKQLLFGILFLLLGSYLGFVFSGRSDGVLDLHFTEKIVWYQPLVDNIINTVLLFILLFTFGKTINKKTRPIDILNPVLIARIPFYLLTFFNANGFISNVTGSILGQIDLEQPTTGLQLETVHIFILLLFTCMSLAFLAWFILLLYHGFKVATNAKGFKNMAWFAITLLLAEVISKITISYLN